MIFSSDRSTRDRVLSSESGIVPLVSSPFLLLLSCVALISARKFPDGLFLILRLSVVSPVADPRATAFSDPERRSTEPVHKNYPHSPLPLLAWVSC